MPNKRISELDESSTLSVSQINNQENLATPTESNIENELFLLLAKEKQSNNKISFSNLTRSINKNLVDRFSNQAITGKKTFEDPCKILKRTNVSQLHGPSDNSIISGYKVISQTGFFEEFSRSGSTNIPGNFFPESSLSTSDGVFSTGETHTRSNIYSKYSSSENLVVFGELHTNSIETNTLSAHGESDFEETVLISGDAYSVEPIQVNENYKLNIKDDITIEKNNSKSLIINSQENEINLSDSLYVNDNNIINSTNEPAQGIIYSYNTGYSTEAYSLIQDSQHKIIPAGDESISFSRKLKSNLKEFEINLPKTFLSKPVISVSITSPNHPTNQAIISNVTNNSFTLKINTESNENTYAEIIASSDSRKPFSTNNEGIYRFYSSIDQGQITGSITYPQALTEKPTLSTTIEGSEHIPLYLTSGVNTSEYKIIFNEATKEDYTIHTTLSTTEYQNLN